MLFRSETAFPAGFHFLSWVKTYNGQLLGFFAMVAATAVYIACALVWPANFDLDRLLRRRIRFDAHCLGCTAGAGSSCGGATA